MTQRAPCDLVRSALAFVTILLAASLAGCFSDDGPPLAQPTDKPPLPPSAPTPKSPTTSYNFTDPGYSMTAPWRAGDGWDYESNQSHFRRVRVIDLRLVEGVPRYYLEEKTGAIGQPAARTVYSWIDGVAWTVLNSTDDLGAVDRYQPGLPIRSFRNASFGYNHSRVESSGRVSANETILIQTRLAETHQTLLFPWGFVEARRVEDTPTVRGATASASKTTTRWVHTDYLNDVQYELPGHELFKLTAVKAGDFRRGQLMT